MEDMNFAKKLKIAAKLTVKFDSAPPLPLYVSVFPQLLVRIRSMLFMRVEIENFVPSCQDAETVFLLFKNL